MCWKSKIKKIFCKFFKSTLIQKLVEQFPDKFEISTVCTTKNISPQEKASGNFVQLTPEEFASVYINKNLFHFLGNHQLFFC